MLSVLGLLAFRTNKPLPGGGIPADGVAPVAVADPLSKNLLINPGFEGESEAVAPAWPGAKGTATGQYGKGWKEDSLWGEIGLEYGIDSENSHGGGASQRIRVVSSGGGQLQFAQRRPAVIGKNYKATVWMRASEENLPVSFLLRQTDTPYKPYKSSDVTVGTKWQQVSVAASPTEAGDMYTMVIFKKAGATLWIDDASLVEVP